MIGLGRPRLVLRIVTWCGHSQDAVLWPGADDYCSLVPIVENARAAFRDVATGRTNGPRQ
jgi:hypothetical protein